MDKRHGLGKSIMRSISALMTFFMGLQAAGCMKVGQDYETPTLSTPEKCSSELIGGLSATPSATPADKTALSQWWTTLNDPELNLIERAIGGNPG